MMTKTTRAQREAIKRVFDRERLYRLRPEDHPNRHMGYPLSYKDFRKTVVPTFGMDGAVVVQWCGMWLCIERDGHVHS
jgi:hypothetical protein